MGGQTLIRVGGALFGAALTAAAGSPDDTAPPRLRATSIELTRLSPLTFQMMTLELGSILADAGVSAVWRRAPPAGETAAEELRIVFLDTPGRGAHAGGRVLAASAPAGPAPTVWVYTPTVTAALGLEAESLLGAVLAQRALGVALGRVLAHELVHLLAPGVPHGTGLMAASLPVAALDGVPATLDPLSATALRAAARAWQRHEGPPPERERHAMARLVAAAAAEHAQ